MCGGRFAAMVDQRLSQAAENQTHGAEVCPSVWMGTLPIDTITNSQLTLVPSIRQCLKLWVHVAVIVKLCAVRRQRRAVTIQLNKMKRIAV